MIEPMIGMMVPRIIDSTVKITHTAIQATPKTIDWAACQRTTALRFSIRKKMIPVIGGTR